MVLDKCELSLELSSFLLLSLVMVNQLICTQEHTFCAMSVPHLHQLYHSIHSDEKWLS